MAQDPGVQGLDRTAPSNHWGHTQLETLNRELTTIHGHLNSMRIEVDRSQDLPGVAQRLLPHVVAYSDSIRESAMSMPRGDAQLQVYDAWRSIERGRTALEEGNGRGASDGLTTAAQQLSGASFHLKHELESTRTGYAR